MKPSEREKLVAELLALPLLSSAPRRPGAAIAALPKRMREKLKELTSKDFYHWISKDLYRRDR